MFDRKKRARFGRIRRARWSLWALGALFAVCLAAEWIWPVDPNAVASAASLEPFLSPSVERTYDVRTARFSVSGDGAVFDFEGPDDVRRALGATVTPARVSAVADAAYAVAATPRADHARYYLEPRTPPAATETARPSAVSFPFPPCRAHPFGLDAAGRDVLARVLHGMRVSLVFGLALTLSGLLIGLAVGALEGYFGGWVDIVFQRLTEVWGAVPFLYIVIFIGSALGRGFAVLLVCYAAFNWIVVGNYVRAEFFRLRSMAFVDAAKVQGLSVARIVFVHVLPNALTPLVTLFPFLLMGAVGSLAALDFLGFGLPPGTPSCGELLRQAQQFREAWWLVLYPSAALFVVMLLTVLVGEGLRDAYDPRDRSRLE